MFHCPFFKRGNNMTKEWDIWELPKEVSVNGNIYTFNADFRNIMRVFEPLNDLDLMDEEKAYCALNLFYDDLESIQNEDIEECILAMWRFLNGNKEEEPSSKKEKPLFDWKQDFNIIIAPINRIAQHDIRLDTFVHWWTFLSMFMEIGECTFNTYVGIRDKKNRGKKLEKYEEQIYRDNINAIKLKSNIKTSEQDIINAIMNGDESFINSQQTNHFLK